jgi:alpha-beta hydrolase superfamily lysophospholipase
VQLLPDYSQAEFHTAEGFVVVACDQLGVGDSSHPDTFALTYESLAAATPWGSNPMPA